MGFFSDEKENVKKEASEKFSGAEPKAYIDLKLFKKLGNSNPKEIEKLKNSAITVRISVPENIRNASEADAYTEESRSENLMTASDTKVFYLVDIEDMSKLAETTGTTLEFSTDVFKTYAILAAEKAESGTETEINAGYVAKQRVDATKLMDLPAGVKIKYVTSNKKLARVSRKGVIKIRKNPGTVTITAKNRKTGATIRA